MPGADRYRHIADEVHLNERLGASGDLAIEGKENPHVVIVSRQEAGEAGDDVAEAARLGEGSDLGGKLANPERHRDQITVPGGMTAFLGTTMMPSRMT